jgi:hypothetical protein
VSGTLAPASGCSVSRAAVFVCSGAVLVWTWCQGLHPGRLLLGRRQESGLSGADARLHAKPEVVGLPAM